MKVKIKTLLISIASLRNVGSLKLGGPVKLRLARIIKQVNVELETFDEERKKMNESYGGIFDKEKTAYVFSDKEKEAAADKEVDEMAEVEVDIIFDKFSEKTFEPLEISALDIINLEWLLVEELDIPKEEVAETPEPAHTETASE